jgi:hypothetical protein
MKMIKASQMSHKMEECRILARKSSSCPIFLTLLTLTKLRMLTTLCSNGPKVSKASKQKLNTELLDADDGYAVDRWWQ